MRRIKPHYIAFVLMLLTFGACIKPYSPEILGSDERRLVVLGNVNNIDTIQMVKVTYTSSINDPEDIPAPGCDVTIVDGEGNRFHADDRSDGYYSVFIAPEAIRPGAAFMIEIIAPDGDRIVSQYDTVHAVPGVDSIYYIREDKEGAQPDDITMGVQFYCDFTGNDQDSRYFRFEPVETWEYHTEYPIEWYYDGEIHHVIPPDYSKMVCWITKSVKQIFLLSTEVLSVNSVQKFPLQYVKNNSSRLQYGYSLLLKQTALSADAYLFWDRMQQNSNQNGGLYETQPVRIMGNLTNLSSPKTEVLGFFGASMVSEKRVFVREVPGLPLEVETFCSPTLLRMGLRELAPRFYPAYLMGDAERWYPIWLNTECVDCTLGGGENVKPIFWPDDWE